MATNLSFQFSDFECISSELFVNDDGANIHKW